MICSTLVNHFTYVDDLFILGPSAAGLQEHLDIGSKHCLDYDVNYYASKSALMICRKWEDKGFKFPQFNLCGNNLALSNKYKYLGHFINEPVTDDNDIYQQCGMMY